jgi:hypothetical protein
MRKLDPAHIEYVYKAIDAGYRTILMRLQNGTRDDHERELLIALGNLMNGLEVFMEIVPHRIERLHQKLDRIEKKIGSV